MAEIEELQGEVKIAIVQALAAFDPPSAVVAMVNEEFGLKVSPQRVMKYNPSKASGADLGEKLKALFFETRKQWLEGKAEVGIANRMVRLRRCQRIADRAATSGNAPLELTALEQAAKEEGGAFTNRRELTGKDGGPIKTEGELAVVTDRDRAKALAALIARSRTATPPAS
jgi:hypothetical protein